MGMFKEIEIEQLDSIWKSLDSLQASFFGIDQGDSAIVESEDCERRMELHPEVFEAEVGECGVH